MKDLAHVSISTITMPLRSDYIALVFEDNPAALNDFRWCGELWLFNTPLHIIYQKATKVYTFILADSLTQTDAFGVFHLSVVSVSEALVGISPYRGSFGSFEVANRVSHADFSRWLHSIEVFIKNLGINAIEIKHYPDCYHPSKSAFIKRGLLRHGFLVSQIAENQFIEVTKMPFENGLHASERRRLRKCLGAGFRFEEWQNPCAKKVHAFIELNRQLLGYSLSFSLEQLQTWLDVFSDKFKVFCVKDGHIIASFTVTVRVGEQVLYNFCPADHLSYRTFSPAVLLNKGLYEYAQNQGVRILDLGVSIDEAGLLKRSLKRFKNNLGAKDSDKQVFRKVIV